MRKKNTELLSWLKSAGEDVISLSGTTRGHLLQIAYGNRRASAEIAARLESATEGQVTRKQLRPEDWTVIWPELAARNGQADRPDSCPRFRRNSGQIPRNGRAR